MLPQFGVVFVVAGPHRSFLNSALHAFGLAVGPWVVGFAQAVIDMLAGTGDFEGVSAKEFSALQGGLDVRRGRSGIAGGSKVRAVVGEHCVNFVGDELDGRLQKVGGVSCGRTLDEPGKSKLGGAIHDHNPELIFLGPDLVGSRWNWPIG